MEKGLCQCGCGGKTSIINKTDKRSSDVKGEYYRFIRGHWAKKYCLKREEHHSWRGGVHYYKGHTMVYQPDHPKAKKNGYVFEHTMIVEEILGYSLPPEACIHHINGNGKDNRKENLIVCQDRSYHLLLHRRMKAYQACGDANKRQCKYCKQWDDPENMYILLRKDYSYLTYHKNCYNNRRYVNKK